MRLFDDNKVDDMISQGLWTTDTWNDLLAAAVRQYGPRTCIVDAINKADFMGQPPQRLTWDELESAVDRCAAELFAGGVRQGDVIGVQIPNSIELAVTYLAINRLGAIFSPYPMPYRGRDVAQLAAIAGARHLVTTGGYVPRDLETELALVADGFDDPGSVFAWYATNPNSIPIGVLIEAADDLSDSAYRSYVESLDVRVNDCVLIIFTSGTTGVPKGVPRAHCDTIFGAFTNVAHPRLTHDSVLLNTMPMVNAGSIGGIFQPWLACGCTLVQHQPFDLDVFVDQIERERVTYTVVAPTILNDMAADESIFERHDLSSLTSVGAGSAPLSGWSIDVWERNHGIEVINFFGASEGMQLTANADTVPDPVLRARYLPIPRSPRFAWRQPIERQAKVRLVDLDDDSEITEPGRPGELRFTSPSVFAGYLHNVDDPFDELGYLRSGDIFEIAADVPDMLVHVDRKKDLIIRGGMNISAAEVESLLVGHPKVAEVAAVGRKDERLGERTCVFVVPRTADDPPTLDELIDHLRAQDVATFKLPEFLELAEQLPRNPSGKVLKRELRLQLNGDASAI